jgi:DNA transposition AAA+ family ATPase
MTTTEKQNLTYDGPAAMSSRKMRIAGDVVNKATADLPEDQRSAIRWLHDHAWQNNLSMEEIAASIDYNPNTLYQILTGRHGADKRNVTTAIEKFKHLTEARAGTDKIGFVETATSRKIWRVCEASLVYQRIAFIFSDSQVGKTRALEEYARLHNHGETILVRVPTGGTLGYLLGEFCRVLRISPQIKLIQLRQRIIDCFSGNMLLIVDEAHQCFSVGFRGVINAKTDTLDFIREIHDRTGCGLVFAATNIFRQEMESGRAAPFLTQLSRRRLAALQLPNEPTKADLDAFAKAYDLPPATGEDADLQRDIIRSEALGMWLTLLRMAATKANRDKVKLTWDHIHTARNRLAKLES